MRDPIMLMEELKDVKMIYIRFRGGYVEFRRQSGKMFKELFSFAQKQNLIVPEVTKVLTIYDDNPFVTKSKDLRTSVAMIVDSSKKIEEEGLITVGEISGKFMVGHFDLSIKEYPQAWKYMYNHCLNNQNIELRDAPPFELYVNEPAKGRNTTSLTDIYLPIK